MRASLQLGVVGIGLEATAVAAFGEDFESDDRLNRKPALICRGRSKIDRDRIGRTLAMDVLRLGRLRAFDIHPIERKPSARQGVAP